MVLGPAASSSSASSASPSGGMAVFEPSRFERIHRVINEAASNPLRLSRSNDWFVAIDRNRAHLADLGRVRPPSDVQRKELEAGKITIDGKTQQLNADFAQQSLLLSRELAVSEHYAASLLQHGLAGRAKWARPAVEVACILYHREKLALLACLKDLIRNALTMPFEQEPEAQRMGFKMEQLVETLVSIQTTLPASSIATATTTTTTISSSTSTTSAGSKSSVNLPERVLAEIDAVKYATARVKASLESPSSSTHGIQTHTSSFLGLGSAQSAQQQQQQTASAAVGRLGDEIQLERLGWLREERRELGHILYLLSISSLLSTSNIAALLRWLAAVSAESYDEMTIYVLTALLGSIDTSPDARDAMAERASRGAGRTTVDSLLDDDAFITATQAQIAKAKWNLGELNSAVALQWSIFLVEAFSRNPTLRSQLSISEDDIQDLVLQSITGSPLSTSSSSSASIAKPASTSGPQHGPTGGAFVFLVVRILAFRQKALDVLYGQEEAAGAEAEAAAEVADANGWEEEVDTEFREYVIQQVQSLTFGVTSIMLPMLRRIQRSEEDAAYALSRGTNMRAGVPLPKERRYDIEALFDLVALLCRARPEAGLSLWVGPDNRTTRFLAWAIDVREPGHQRALLNMLAAMSSGPQSASQAYALLDQESVQNSGGAGLGEGPLVSWSRLFEWITYYIDTFHQTLSNGTFHPSSYNSVAMPKNEETLLIGFVRLLRNVVYFSSPARDALLQNGNYNALDKLFSLLTCPVPVELKASILDALAAFAHPGSAQGARFSSIATQLWDRLDACGLVSLDEANRRSNAGTISTPAHFGPAFRPMASKGVLYELENFEAPLRTFPGSTSFVNFLKALVQLPSPSDRAVSAMLSNSNPAIGSNPFVSISTFDSQTMQQQQLQQSQLQHQQQQRAQQQKLGRSVEPYVNFVIDQVFLQARTREYAEPAEQWRVVSSCLDFIDRSLRSYDLVSLLRNAESTDTFSDAGVLAQLASHPGFFIMKRLLTGSKLVGELLGILVPGSGLAAFEAVNQNRASTLFYGSSVRHVLAILERVLRYQDAFVQVLVPTLVDAAAGGVHLSIDVTNRVGNPGAYTSFDVQLLHAHESVVQIALLINCVRDDIALLSVRLLSLIAQTTAFSAVDRFGEMGYRRKMNRLVGLLEMSDEAERVKAGYVGRLEAEPSADADPKAIEALLALTSGGDGTLQDSDVDSTFDGIDGPGGVAIDVVEAIQMAILDLFLISTEASRSAPNLAHLLLGYDLRAVRPEEQVIVDPDAQTSPPSALHTILALLRPDDDGSTSGLLSLAERSPGFAEKCYALVLRLGTHPFTSSATLRYLRTKEDFVVQQIRTLSLVPAERTALSSSPSAVGVVQFTDGQMLETSVDRVIASLRIRASLLELTALELHSLLNAGTPARAARVVAALFSSGATIGGGGFAGDESADGEDMLFGSTERDFRFGNPGGEVRTFGGVRFLELLQSLDFEWQDDREALGRDIHIITPEQLEVAKRADAATGPRLYDLKAVLAVLLREKTLLQQNGSLNDAGQTESFLQQSAAVLQWASAQNAKKSVAFSRRRVLQAWRHALDMVLARATGLLRVENRSTLMFDCLSELLPRISAPSNEVILDTPSADLVAGAVLSLLTSLRQHRVEMTTGAFDLDSADSLPVDRLIATLRALIDSILRLETTTLARGNLYSALINFLQLVKASQSSGDSSTGNGGAGDDASLSAFDRDETMSMGGFSSTTTNAAAFGGRAASGSLDARTRALLLSHAERLIDVLGRDALDASDLSKTIAFTLLDQVCALDSAATHHSATRRSGSKCLELLERRGFIRSFVVALRDSDQALQEVLRPDPSSLNAIYVYEARLAFFNRIAQTREGAEKLLGARIFDVLAQSDYLAARPDQDQDFVDLDSFLPAATERYNALLTPVLQLSTSILASTSIAVTGLASATGTYGSTKALAATSSHAAPRHAVSLLTAHRDAFLAVLSAPLQEFCSLSQLGQAHLVVSLFVFVLPMLDDDALLPPSPLAPFHTALLAFAAAYLQTGAKSGRVVPNSDAEREEASTPAAASTSRLLRSANDAVSGAVESESAFDAKVAAQLVRVQMALLSYLEGASDARGNAPARIRPVLIPSLAAYRERVRAANGGGAGKYGYAEHDEDGDASGTGYLRNQRAFSVGSNVPSLGTLVAALDTFADAVNRDLQKLEEYEAILDNVDEVRQDELDDVVRDVLRTDVAGDLAPMQRRSIAVRELRSRKTALRASSATKLDAMELFLVLLIRHIELFSTLGEALEQKRPSSTILPASLTGATLQHRQGTPGSASNGGANYDRTALLQGLAERLLPVVEEKIGYLSLPPSLVANARERQSFLQMAGRRLASLLSEES
ncbi:hypothetical protein BCV70DRAFT_198714 [Testicularia cyperi]|uniref:Nucleoporin n=1 Tax=Testicularia cyperi TaxID=1882483 RepID=A0A317XWF0_9BASI|nr:hypothetical protein BCV70DRAFT_198714 [Testicularia cyperi]